MLEAFFEAPNPRKCQFKRQILGKVRLNMTICEHLTTHTAQNLTLASCPNTPPEWVFVLAEMLRNTICEHLTMHTAQNLTLASCRNTLPEWVSLLAEMLRNTICEHLTMHTAQNLTLASSPNIFQSGCFC